MFSEKCINRLFSTLPLAPFHRSEVLEWRIGWIDKWDSHISIFVRQRCYVCQTIGQEWSQIERKQNIWNSCWLPGHCKLLRHHKSISETMFLSKMVVYLFMVSLCPNAKASTSLRVNAFFCIQFFT